MSRAGLLAAVVMLTGSQGLMGQSMWPEVGSDQKPWTRWWWLGSGVDEVNLTRELEAFAAAGLGGVEICPIYGAKGYEDRDREFLSEEWLAALAHTTREAKRLGLGVDLTTGTGWPFGGPWVSTVEASKGLERINEEVAGGERIRKEVKGSLIALRAVPKGGGAVVDLGGFYKGQRIDWTAPAGEGWRVLGLFQRTPIQKVKRAAPGGAGNVLDPYSEEAIHHYLARFDEAFEGFEAPLPRAHFHDSFEYYGAEWTPGLLAAFRQQHGYDLLEQLPAFLGVGGEDVVGRVQSDWRSTLSDMHRRYLTVWNHWAVEQGSMTRNQAHGSPGNLLDHYSVANIPETEIFRHVDDAQWPMIGLAASAAHLTGRKLVSAESFTWLAEHFQVRPAALKEAADFLLLGGVNHLFYHGTPYTPEDAPWPGWLFYASTHMGPNGGLWKDLPEFNAYLARVQSILQGGRPDSEVLLYFPFEDYLSDAVEKLPLFTIHNQDQWLHGSPFHRVAMSLIEQGVPYEAVSSDLLKKAEVKDGHLVLGDVEAKVLVVPGVKLMSATVLGRLLELSNSGATVLFVDSLPEDVPGYGRLESRRQVFLEQVAELKGRPGRLVAMEGLQKSLVEQGGVAVESMAGRGLRFVRRATEGGWDYFVVNQGAERVDAFVELARGSQEVILMSPETGGRIGRPQKRMVEGRQRIRLVLSAGESVVIRCLGESAPGVAMYPYRDAAGEVRSLEGGWKVDFVEGGAELPESFEMGSLRSWTAGEDSARRSFSGTARYTRSFSLAEEDGSSFVLDLGEVAETCRVRLNGQEVGASFFPPHVFDISKFLKSGANLLEVEVTNLAANRIADLDRRGVDWKRFHEINFVNIDYKPFDASGWEPMDSGLLGPVQIVPVK